MSRPALSALRALEIIDLMAGLPAQAFTLSEIARLTGTNVASCHAILNVLVSRGYLLRHPTQKAYRLAPSIVAIGEAAAAHDALLANARDHAAQIARLTEMEVSISARAGTDIIGVARYGDLRMQRPSLRVGQRVPMRPPIGGIFMAWTSAEEIETWIAPDGTNTPPAMRAAHKAALALVRERGFLVTLDSPEHNAFTREIGDTSSTESGTAIRLASLLAAMDNSLYQPATIAPAGTYPVKVICVPIFSAHGPVLYALNLHFPAGTIRGAVLLDLAGRLLDASAATMHADALGPSVRQA